MEHTIHQNTSSRNIDQDSYKKQTQEFRDRINILQIELATAQETSTNYLEALSEKQKELANKDKEINQLRQINLDQQDVINNQQVPTVNNPQQQNINLLDDIAMADVADVLKESLQELISHQNKQQIPFYSGFLNDQPIEDWLKDAERVARTAGWNNPLKLKFFSDRLRGIAATFNDEYLDTNQNPTYADWKQALVTRFYDDNAREGHKKELDELLQGPNQRVSDFKSYIDQKFIKAYGKNAEQSGDNEMKKIREDIKKKILLKGLKPKILELLWQRIKPNDNFDKIVEGATEIETMLLRKESITPNRPNSPGTNMIESTLLTLADKINALTLKTELLTNKGNYNVNTISRRPRSRSFDRYRNRDRSQERYTRTPSKSPGRNDSRSGSNSRASRSRSPGERSYSPNTKHLQHRSRSRSHSQDRNKRQGWTAGPENRQKKKVVFHEDTLERNKGQCYNCGKTGHIAKNCWSSN